MGDMTLRPVADDGAGGSASVSFATGDDPRALFDSFAETGGFPPGAVGSDDAAHGAVALTVPVAAGENATLSIVLAWHFPDRDFSGEILGNMYTELWDNSSTVAAHLGKSTTLASVVADLNAHHHAIAGRSNPMPEWLKDQLVNQWSHFHSEP